jgi:hypothetical protein
MTKQDNPLINKLNRSNVMPGMTFRLPSKGIPYKGTDIISDEVLDGEVVVHPMNTLDEIYLKTPDMLFQGTAIDKVIGRCCPQILKPTQLLAKDVDYLLTCLRLISYGNLLQVPYTCECPNAKEVELQVPISDFLNKTKEMKGADLVFELNGFQITLKYVNFENMIKLNQENRDLSNPDELFETFLGNIAVNIESVDVITDRDQITEWLRVIDRKFQMDILNKIEKVNNWGINLEYKFTCKYCSKKKSVPIALNPVSFFTEPSSQDQQTSEED